MRRHRLILGLLLACGLLWATPAQAVIALVAHTVAGAPDSSSAPTTSAIDTTGATLLIVAISHQATFGEQAPSDSKGNTWVLLSSVTTTTDTDRMLDTYYVQDPTGKVGSGHTFSTNANASKATIFVAAFSDSDVTAAVDQKNSTAGVGGSGTGSQATGTVTPSVNNELVIAATGMHFSTTNAITINGGFTLIDTLIEDANHWWTGGGLAYLIQTTATAANPTWTETDATYICTSIATFKASGAATSVPARARIQ